MNWLTVVIEVRANGEEIAEINIIGTDQGTEVVVARDKSVRQTHILGFFAVALLSAIDDFKMSGQLLPHWADIRPMLMDAIELNELQVEDDMMRDGYIPGEGYGK